MFNVDAAVQNAVYEQHRTLVEKRTGSNDLIVQERSEIDVQVSSTFLSNRGEHHVEDGSSPSRPNNSKCEGKTSPLRHVEKLDSANDLIEYDKPDEDNTLPYCWWCRCVYCCCGCLQKDSAPFKYRMVDCLVYPVFRCTGLYAGGSFDRKRWNLILGGTKVYSRVNFSGVRTLDTSIVSQSSSDVTIPIRLFYPPNNKNLNKIIVFFHGGGWVIGTPHSSPFHVICKRFAKEGYLVVAPDYRLAPENTFPIPVYDCYDALCWASIPNDLFGHADTRNLIVGGDSAGGNLALVLTTLVRDRLGPSLEPSDANICITHQVLMYPAMFMDRYVEQRPPFYLSLLPKPVFAAFGLAYVPGGVERIKELSRTERRLCPFVAGFNNLPKTIMITAGLDFLRYEEIIAVEQLRKAGVLVVHHHFENVPHGFASFGRLLCPEAVECIRLVREDLRSP